LYNGSDTNYSSYSTTNGVTYYWKVRAYDSYSNGSWSSTYSFSETVGNSGSSGRSSSGGGGTTITDTNVEDSKTQQIDKLYE